MSEERTDLENLKKVIDELAMLQSLGLELLRCDCSLFGRRDRRDKEQWVAGNIAALKNISGTIDFLLMQSKEAVTA